MSNEDNGAKKISYNAEIQNDTSDLLVLSLHSILFWWRRHFVIKHLSNCKKYKMLEIICFKDK